MGVDYKTAFADMRAKQAANQGKTLTPIDETVGNIVLDTAVAAMADTDPSTPLTMTVSMRSVALGTGMGKSMSAYAFIAGAASADLEFSCAYIVPTIRMAVEAKVELDALLSGTGIVPAVWFHDQKKAYTDFIQSKGVRPIARSAIPANRILVCTHELWKGDCQSGGDVGVLNWNGQRRRVLFVDEAPNLVIVVSASVGHVQGLLNRLEEEKSDYEWQVILANVVSRMNTLKISRGQQTYVPEVIITPEEAAVLGHPIKSRLKYMTDIALSDDARNEAAERWVELFVFLECAAKNCVFYNRNDYTFYAYRPVFDMGPGHVLLDATATLARLVALSKAVERVAVPEVRYGDLTLLHLPQPTQWQRMDKVTELAGPSIAYAAWMRSVVLANSQPGDKVLVVTHKKLLDQERIDRATDPAKPLDWDGRHVNTIHWGGPYTGTNEFKDCTHVFCFGEFHRPRPKTISEHHAMSGELLDVAVLRNAEGKQRSVGSFAPTGPYEPLFDGGLCAQTKQMAMRGRARHVGGTGEAAPMVLFTSMDLGRLNRFLPEMFPGARVTPAVDPGGPPAKSHGPIELCRIMAAEHRARRTTPLSALEIQAATGIKPDQLARTFSSPTCQNTAVVYGWSLVKAIDLGLAGKSYCLVPSTQARQTSTGFPPVGEAEVDEGSLV